MSKGLLCLAVLVVFLLQSGLVAAQQPRVEAHDGSVAIGGMAVGNTFNVGVPREELAGLIPTTEQLSLLSSKQQQEIATLQSNLKLNERQVRTALQILGEANVPDEQLVTKLTEVAERFKALQATAIA